MKLPRDVSGEDLVRALCKEWGYAKVHQEGSHIILETAVPSHQRISIPNHESLRLGTLHSILRSIADHNQVAKDRIVESL